MIADEPCESKNKAAIHFCLLMTNHIQFTRTSCKLFSISLKLHELIHFHFNFESMIHILIFLAFLLLGQLNNFPFVANYLCVDNATLFYQS